MKNRFFFNGIVLGFSALMMLNFAFAAENQPAKDPAPKADAPAKVDAPAKTDAVIIPFNGRDLAGWKCVGEPDKNKWVAGIAQLDPDDPAKIIAKPGTGELINVCSRHRESSDLYTEQKFGDCRIELEVMVPKGANSGIYVLGEYEIQVLDSYGKEKPENGDMGAVYGEYAPKVNACKAPGQWQSFVIEFRAARFDASGKVVKDAKLVKVTLNGQTLHENLDLSITPGGLTGKVPATGPLLFQGNHGPVAFRNIKITPLPEQK